MNNMIEWYSRSMRNFWQGIYDSVLLFFGNDDFKATVCSSYILAITVYCIVGSLYTIVDLTKRPKWLYRYKLQDTEVTIKDVIHPLKQVTINMTVVTLTVTIVGYYIRSLIKADTRREIPTLYIILKEYIVFEFSREVMFYYTHRLLHYSVFYKYIHKRHHEWHSPISITATYCHPIEHILVNLSPILIGPLIMRSHLFTVWLWIIYVLFFTLNKHSGYEFPYFPSSAFHNYHHLKFNQNYGLLGFLDRLHGTDDRFRKTEASRRHGFFTHFKFTSNIFPGLNKTWLSILEKRA